MKPFIKFDHRWFALGAIFSLFSLFAFVNGEWIWLMNLMFLGNLMFLMPVSSGKNPGGENTLS